MPLKSMKMSPEEMKEKESRSVLDGSAFPYGLQIHLNYEAYEKLGLGEIPKIGDSFALLGKVEVTGLNKDKGLDDRQKVNMTLQITDMALEEAKEEQVQDAGEKLYGSD